ncbi:MAG: aminopeptidase [Deltaproteobacteria bacterium]|nr:aminopeptidase [Deltaproteobacteria bacterium]
MRASSAQMAPGCEARSIRDRRRRARAALLALAVAVTAAGCSPTYVLRAGYEEAKILWRREPIARVLARPDLEVEVRRKLELVLAAREYAAAIGLRVGGSFTTLSYVDGPIMLHVLTATPRTSLEPHTWWFPIVGRVPYKGFFDRALAEAEAKRLAAEGLDTSLRGAAAFSTLGWFDDPLLRHQLAADDVALVNLVLHETYHNTFYASGAHATAFNESLATFVGHRAAIDFFAARPGGAALAAEARDAWEDERTFASFVQALAARLRRLYATRSAAAALEERAVLFREAQAAFPALPFHGRRFEKFDDAHLNNAVLLQFLLYTTDLDLFETIAVRLGGVRPALDVIEAAARREPGDPFGAARRAVAP